MNRYAKQMRVYLQLLFKMFFFDEALKYGNDAKFWGYVGTNT
jgi:hypothetical protein